MVFLIINLLTNIDFHTNHNKKYISEYKNSNSLTKNKQIGG